MNRYAYRDQMLTINELSEMSGVKPHTLRDRLRRGFTVEQAVRPVPVQESVEQFFDASYWQDWLGMSIDNLYQIYWKWCMAHNYKPSTKQGFSRQLCTICPYLKTVPTAKGDQCARIIRMRG